LDERLPVEMETSIYRIIQESLTNIARHAQASTASVMIDRRRSSVRLIVEDNGVGLDLKAVGGKSLGLQGIRERAALFNGRLTIESQPGQGTSLFVELPCDETLTHPKNGQNHE
jgi:signal transduction histidine kinase